MSLLFVNNIKQLFIRHSYNISFVVGIFSYVHNCKALSTYVVRPVVDGPTAVLCALVPVDVVSCPSYRYKIFKFTNLIIPILMWFVLKSIEGTNVNNCFSWSTRILLWAFNGYHQCCWFHIFIPYVHELFNLSQQVDIIFTDFSKAFD